MKTRKQIQLCRWNVRKSIDPYTTAKSCTRYHYTYEIDNYTDILQDHKGVKNKEEPYELI